jgi:hypothetical protein
MVSSEDSSGDSVSYDAGLGGLLCWARSSGEEIRRKQHTAARLGVKLSTASGQHRGIHEEGSIEGRPRTAGFLVLKPPWVAAHRFDFPKILKVHKKIIHFKIWKSIAYLIQTWCNFLRW